MTEPVPIVTVSNYALVIKSFLDHVQRQFPNIAFVYDEELSYETSVRAFRRNQNIDGDTSEFLPALAFKRNVLRYREAGTGRRSTVCSVLDVKQSEDRAFKYRAISGSLDIEFLFIDTVAEELEKFEMIYLSGALLNRATKLKVPIPELGDFEYQVEFNPLESKILNLDGNYYKGVQGTITFGGMFLLFEGTSPIIKEIKVATKNFHDSVNLDNNVTLCEHTIVPT